MTLEEKAIKYAMTQSYFYMDDVYEQRIYIEELTQAYLQGYADGMIDNINKVMDDNKSVLCPNIYNANTLRQSQTYDITKVSLFDYTTKNLFKN